MIVYQCPKQRFSIASVTGRSLQSAIVISLDLRDALIAMRCFVLPILLKNHIIIANNSTFNNIYTYSTLFQIAQWLGHYLIFEGNKKSRLYIL